MQCSLLFHLLAQLLKFKGTGFLHKHVTVLLLQKGWKTWSIDSTSCSLTQIGIQSWQAFYAKFVEKNTIWPL
jgi:hypothetical protein